MINSDICLPKKQPFQAVQTPTWDARVLANGQQFHVVY